MADKIESTQIHSPKKRVLLGQLGARGDCLYATAVARQIKHDYPDCHLTWAIGSMARSILDGNPYVDEIWEFPMAGHSDMAMAWRAFEKEAVAAKERGEFDQIFLTQIFPNNFKYFDGTVRSSIFRAYPGPITVPVEPVIFLNAGEIDNVRNFSREHKLDKGHPVILFECSVNSGQSFVCPDFALKFSHELLGAFPEVRVVLSSNSAIEVSDERIVDGSKLSFRENAELTKYCSLLIGGSSGVSWLCTSTWAKPLPMIQLLKKNTSVFASFVHDYEYRGADTTKIIEMTDCSPHKLFQCVSVFLHEGFDISRAIFHEKIQVDFDHYFGVMKNLLLEGEVNTVFHSISHLVNRYGFRVLATRALWITLARFGRDWLVKLVRYR